MKVMVPTEARDLTVAQILILPLDAPERLEALIDRRAELRRREAIMQERTTEGRGSPLTALRAELREADIEVIRYTAFVENYSLWQKGAA